MRARTTYLLAAAAMVALAAGWQFGLRSVPVGQVEVAPGTLVFPGLAAKLQQADRIEATHQGKTMVIARKDGKWGLADRGGFPIQSDKLRELLTGLTELRITEARTADPAQFARLGVEDAQPATSNSTLLRVLAADGSPLAELIVGHRRVRTQGNLPESIYIRRPGETQSWVAEGRLPVDADPQLWFDRDIANIDHSRITSVVVTRGDTVLDFARDGDKLVLKSPADHPKLDDYRLEEIARGLETLTLTDVKPVAQQPGEKIGTAVVTTTDGLKITIGVFRSDKDIWIQLAAAGDGTAKAEADALQARVGNWAYQVGSWKEKSFVPTMDDLKASEPAPSAAAAPAEGAPKPAVQ